MKNAENQQSTEPFIHEGRPGTAKFCIVRPPTVTAISAVGQDAVPPVGIAYLLGSLRDAGLNYSLIDAVGENVHQYSRIPGADNVIMHGLTHREIIDRIPADVDVIGISCMFSVEWPYNRELIKEIRNHFPEAQVIAGGEHITAVYEYVLNTCPEIDIAFLGEGEEVLVEFLRYLEQGKDWKEIQGLAYRAEDGTIQASRHNRIREVDSIPLPDWDAAPIRSYIDNDLTHGANLGKTMPIIASRGCPYQCTFCSNKLMWTTRWIARDAQDVINEMKYYMKKYDVTNFDFYDLTAIVKKSWIVEFCNLLIKEDLNITWQLPSGTRSEAMDNEVLSLLYKSGCRIVNYAPESGSPTELKRIKKKVSVKGMLTSMRQAHKNKIQVKVNIIFGLPGQNFREAMETMVFMARLAWTGVEDVASFPYSPYPGTELFDQLVKEGRLNLDDEYFHSLLAYTDPAHSVSFNENFNSRQVSLLCFSSMMLFYSLSWLFRPVRLLKFVGAILRRDSSTKLTMALTHVRKKSKAMKLAQESNTDTVQFDYKGYLAR